jgi:hypothetical protein
MKKLFPFIALVILLTYNCSGPSGSNLSDTSISDIIISIDKTEIRDENKTDSETEESKDTGITDTEEIQDTGVDKTSPYVISAFSVDGKSITVRFSEPIDDNSGSKVENYTIKGSDNSTIAISGVTVKNEFATLSIPSTAVINPQLTYTVLVQNVMDKSGNPLDKSRNKAQIKRSVYLTILWHQHQPTYLDPVKDQLLGPWVRKHSIMSYFKMADILRKYPDGRTEKVEVF